MMTDVMFVIALDKLAPWIDHFHVENHANPKQNNNYKTRLHIGDSVVNQNP